MNKTTVFRTFIALVALLIVGYAVYLNTRPLIDPVLLDAHQDFTGVRS